MAQESAADAAATNPEGGPPSADPIKNNIVQFEEHIAPLLKTRCGECHSGPNPKEDFDVTDRGAMLELIEPGNAFSSELWTEYLMADPDHPSSLIMPPVASGGRLPAGELALIRLWIDEGAYWPEVETPFAAPPTAQAAPTTLPERIWAFQGYLHPATVHFPLGLILMGGMSLFLSLFWKPAESFALYCMVFGTLFGIVAAAMGWSFAHELGYQNGATSLAESRNPTLFWHRWLGVTVPVLGLFFCGVAWFASRSKGKWLTLTWKLGLILLALLVAWVGHQGGELSYGEQLYENAFRRLWGS